MENRVYEELRELISMGDMSVVFDKLSVLPVEGHFREEVIVLTGDWNRLKEKIRLHIISDEKAEIELNQISKRVLDFLHEYRHWKSHDPKEEKKVKYKRAIPIPIIAALFMVMVAAVGYFWKVHGKHNYIFQVKARGIPQEILDVLGRMQAESEIVKCVAITPDFSGWVILYGRNRTQYKDVPKTLVDKLEEFAQNDEEIKQVLLSKHSGWLVLRRFNDYWQSGGFPLALTNILDTFYYRREEIKQVAVGTGHEWAILRNKRDFWGDNLPDDLLAKLWEIYRQGTDDIKGISLGPEDRWIVWVNKNDYFTSPGIDPGLLRQLKGLKAKDATLTQVLLAGDESWLMLFRQ